MLTDTDERTILVHGTRAIGKVLGVSHDTAARWARRGYLPTVRFGRKVALLRSALGPWARTLLRRAAVHPGAVPRLRAGMILAGVSAHPGEGGSVQAPQQFAAGTAPGKKKRAKIDGDSTVVTLT